MGLASAHARFRTGVGVVYYSPRAIGSPALLLLRGHQERTAFVVPAQQAPPDWKPIQITINDQVITVHIQEQP